MTITRCLSVRQPSAWAICAGTKKIENRTWDTPFRGTIAIHASSSATELNDIFKRFNKQLAPPALITRSAIIGVADLVDVAPLSPSVEGEWSAIGPVCWSLENPRILAEPIPMKGKLNLFTLTDEIQAQLTLRLQHLTSAPEAEMLGLATEALKFDPMELLEARYFNYYDFGEFDDALHMVDQAIQLEPTVVELRKLREECLAISKHGFN